MPTYSESFSYTYSVKYNTTTHALSTLGASSLGAETLTDTSTQTITPTATGTDTGLSASGAAASANNHSSRYVGAVENAAGTVIGYLVHTAGKYYIIADSPVTSLTGLTVDITAGTKGDLTLCFMAGTMISTPTGAAAIETLQPGDLVCLAKGGAAPLTWLGRQTISTRFTDAPQALPIRIKAGALAEGVPARDLLVSPGHALLVDGLLVQANALINGTSILQERSVPEIFTYYHAEIAGHDLILAENTPAETFIDNAGHLAFDNWAERPEQTTSTEMDLPRVKAARQLPTETRTRLLTRSHALYGTSEAAAA